MDITKLSDPDLIKRIKKDSDSDSLIELRNRHAKLCVSMFEKYLPALRNNNIQILDLLEEIDFLIYTAANSFNSEKNVKFSTWLANHARYFCLNSLNSNSRYQCVEHEELCYFVEQNQIKNHQPVSIIEQVMHILSQLKDKRIEAVYKLRYLSETKKPVSWNLIARQLKISAQTAINLHERGKQLLQKKLNSHSLPDKI